MKSVIIMFIVLALTMFSSDVFAARPLSCEDAANVGEGRGEWESGFEYADNTDDEYNWTNTFKYGLSDNWDIGMEVPYQYLEVRDGEDVDGLSDIKFCSKLRFLDETQNLPSWALVFSIKTKTGNEDKGLGTGAVDYELHSVFTKELNKIITHFNLGYIRVGAPEGEADDDLISYGWAVEYPFTEKVNLVGELKGEANFQGDFNDNPCSGLLGFNYAFSERVAFDFALGWGISQASSNYSIIAGLTLGL